MKWKNKMMLLLKKEILLKGGVLVLCLNLNYLLYAQENKHLRDSITARNIIFRSNLVF